MYKIKIETDDKLDENEIVIKSKNLDKHFLDFVSKINKNHENNLIGFIDESIYNIEIKDILYIEVVDNVSFIYTKNKCYESKLKLYQLLSILENYGFFRSSKSTILNYKKIKMLKPYFNQRFIAILENNEKTIISRQYVSTLKEILGL